MLGRDGRSKRHVWGGTSDVVHARLSEQVWDIHSASVGFVHHSLLTRNGNCAVDRQLRDISSKIQRHRRGDRSSIELGVKSHCERDLLDSDRNAWSGGHIPVVCGIFGYRTRSHIFPGT